jgi:hypothetical protein
MYQETKVKVHIKNRSAPLPIHDAAVVREINAGVAVFKEYGLDSRFTVRRPSPTGGTVRTIFHASQVLRVDDCVTVGQVAA